MELPLVWLMPLFFLTAALYSSAGFGGASTYLALLSLGGLTLHEAPALALGANLAVIVINLLSRTRDEALRGARLAAPFLPASMTAAWAAGRTAWPEAVLGAALGASLLWVAFSFWRSRRQVIPGFTDPAPRLSWPAALGVGSTFGALGGAVGIGGGVFLSPWLQVHTRAAPQVIAAAASWFILFNSAAGLTGQLQKGLHTEPLTWLGLTAAALAGALVGNRWTRGRAYAPILRQATALLSLAAGLRLLGTAFP